MFEWLPDIFVKYVIDGCYTKSDPSWTSCFETLVFFPQCDELNKSKQEYFTKCVRWVMANDISSLHLQSKESAASVIHLTELSNHWTVNFCLSEEIIREERKPLLSVPWLPLDLVLGCLESNMAAGVHLIRGLSEPTPSTADQTGAGMEREALGRMMFTESQVCYVSLTI